MVGIGAATLGLKGWPPSWPGLLLPLSLTVFCFVWLWGVFQRSDRSLGLVALLILGALGAHLALWFPFLFASYLAGHGSKGVDYSLGAALVTSGVVGWYILTDHPWVTVAGLACLAAIRALPTAGFGAAGQTNT